MRLLLAVAVLLLAGCAAPGALPDPGADALLLGELHDADEHRDLQEQWVDTLAQRGRLAAVTLEMAERGASTAGLPAAATESDVQRALGWNTEAWPWDRYRPAVMAAVRAGVPVLGANLPRAQMRASMSDDALDRLLPDAALQAQQAAIRSGHCDLLPESQVAPMTRVQIARDVAMAQTVAAAVQPGKTVVLLAGAGHVRPDLGVPLHLPATLRVRPLVLPPPARGPAQDHCAQLRRRFAPTRAP
jgi:uncharacterized iron-regulated protein